MARRTSKVTATAGRDAGKVFALTELPADQAERWAARAFFAIMNSGVGSNAPAPDFEELQVMGFAGLMAVGFEWLQRVPFEMAAPLLDEMMQCVKIIPDPKHPEVERALISDDIEEIATRLMLRKEVYLLHAQGLKIGAPSS